MENIIVKNIFCLEEPEREERILTILIEEIKRNSGWKMSPDKANRWMVDNMFPFYPPGDLKTTDQEK